MKSNLIHQVQIIGAMSGHLTLWTTCQLALNALSRVRRQGVMTIVINSFLCGLIPSLTNVSVMYAALQSVTGSICLHQTFSNELTVSPGMPPLSAGHSTLSAIYQSVIGNVKQILPN